MVRVASSRGGFVNVQIKGIAQVKANLERKRKRLIGLSEVAVLRAGNFVQQEVQESIIGNRAEPKSVDSGLLSNSIDLEFKKTLFGSTAVITPGNVKYPGKDITTNDVATHLEYGTSRGITRRAHFRNTKARVIPIVFDEFKANLIL